MMHRVPVSDERLLAPRESRRLLPVQGLALLPCPGQRDPRDPRTESPGIPRAGGSRQSQSWGDSKEMFSSLRSGQSPGGGFEGAFITSEPRLVAGPCLSFPYCTLRVGLSWDLGSWR